MRVRNQLTASQAEDAFTRVQSPASSSLPAHWLRWARVQWGKGQREPGYVTALRDGAPGQGRHRSPASQLPGKATQHKACQPDLVAGTRSAQTGMLLHRGDPDLLTQGGRVGCAQPLSQAVSLLCMDFGFAEVLSLSVLFLLPKLLHRSQALGN